MLICHYDDLQMTLYMSSFFYCILDFELIKARQLKASLLLLVLGNMSIEALHWVAKCKCGCCDFGSIQCHTTTPMLLTCD